MVRYCFERPEKKYLLNENQLSLVLEGIKENMKPDEYGKYTIYNIYYDTDDWQLIRDSVEKPVYKEKLRVRSYGPPAPGSNVYDEYSVRRLCTILADNAIKYALPGTEIFFSLKKAKKGVVITTVNECDYLEREETEKLFGRFYRADKSRNSARSGFGIGLSAARRIVENHKGSIKAECENGHTITFTAEL